MAKVYGKSEYSIGLKHKTGSAFGTMAVTSGTYKLLPVINVSSPVLNLIESGEIRSNNAGMIELDRDQFRSRKGGFVTLDFEVPAELGFTQRLVTNVLQDHTQSGSGSNLVHTTQAKSGALLSRPDFDTSSAFLFDIALYGAGSGEDKLITNAVLQSLTMNFDMSDGRLLLSGTFYSGFASSSGFLVGQTVGSEPALHSGTPTQIESYFDTKQLDVNGSATNLVMTGVSFTFENNLARVGRAADGDAENYAFGIPSVNITGELSFMYDDNFNDGANNVISDFLAGNTATLTLKQTSDGTVDAAGEMSIVAEIYSTAVDYDLNADTGAIITIPFKVVQPTHNSTGAIDGTAFEFKIVDGQDVASW
jgi:hypothetical protein